jgi:predicted glycogen debranching enzyme
MTVVRRLPWPASELDWETRLSREWLVTNGLGGYASGTVSGIPTRRFHGLLVAALPAPLGRTMILNHLAEELRLPDGTVARLGGEERVSEVPLPEADHLSEFRLEAGLPVWHYQVGPVALEKRLLIPHAQNTVHVRYHLLEGASALRLRIRPAVHFRPHEGRLGDPREQPYAVTVVDDRYEIAGGQTIPPLRLAFRGAPAHFTFKRFTSPEIVYRVEERRGYDARGEMWSPGYFQADVAPGTVVTFIASTEPWETIDALSPDEALALEVARRRSLIAAADVGEDDAVAAELVVAADQFIITPVGRVEDVARARAAGDEVRTVIAGYHWFTDWGRDTMISLEGLTLCTGRHAEAGWILRTFAHYVRDGLIPNMFPEGENEGLYHTADATLWFFQAVERYLAWTGDRHTLRVILPTLQSIVEHHLRGTRFGIGVDPEDGLMRQGAEGYQLTWMDAKVDGWVVTPRRGKAVEINALWYNALRLLEHGLQDEKQEAAAEALRPHAARARASFNQRFWYEGGGHLYDVVDGEMGDDPACRPNQLLAIALTHAVLEESRWPAVLGVVRERLLTPVGLRSLAPGHNDYKPRYDGDLRSRDAAYHQGTVWGWLAGPLVDAWLKVHPRDREGARRLIEGFVSHFGEACIGSISEIFDAEPPFTPRGCVAQAWSVAEVLRTWRKTAQNDNPPWK